MDAINTVLTALAAGANAGVQNITSQVFQDTYAALKTSLQKRFASKPEAEHVLNEYEHNQQTWKESLKTELEQAHIDEAQEIIEVANELIDLSQRLLKQTNSLHLTRQLSMQPSGPIQSSSVKQPSGPIQSSSVKQPSGPIQSGSVKQPWSRWWLVIVAILIVFGSGYAIFQRFYSSSTDISPAKISGIGVTQIGNESIGISDGSYAFDTTLRDGSLKSQAAQLYKQNSNNVDQITSLLNQAIAINSNDAEALIYQEDLSVVNSRNPYVTIVVATMLSGNDSIVSVGREDLQGAYVAQKEFNDGSKLARGVQVRLLIANIGSKPEYVPNVTSQIIQLAHNDKTFIGVMGLPLSRYAKAGIDALSSADIPLVSQASLDSLARYPYFFRVVPSDEQQGEIGAKYAIDTLHAKNVALFDDQQDPFSSDLAQDFKQNFQNDGGHVAVEETYTVGQPRTLSSELQDALKKNPDLIYFSGYPGDASILLSELLPNNPPVLGGSALYELGAYSSTARASGFSHLHFTSGAYPDEWDILHANQKPAFFSEYPAYFDPNSLHQGSPYGFTRADDDTITSYDTILAMLSACNVVLLHSGKQSVVPKDLQNALQHLNGTNAIQGVSGQIAFDANSGDPINKAIMMLSVDSQGHIYMDPANILEGQFIKQ